MEQNTNIGTDVLELLQPELLSEDELKQILVSRCVTQNLSNCTKNELVKLFRKIALPLPQRQYSGTSWRERMLSQKQQRTAKRRLSETTTDANSSQKQEPGRKVQRLNSDSNTSPQERLKPPPDQINYNRKVIKLNQTSKNDKSKPELDKVVIKNKSKEKDDEKDKKQVVGTEANGKKAHIVRTESIIRKKPESVAAKSENSKDDSIKSETSPKKKRQKIVISW